MWVKYNIDELSQGAYRTCLQFKRKENTSQCRSIMISVSAFVMFYNFYNFIKENFVKFHPRTIHPCYNQAVEKS